MSATAPISAVALAMVLGASVGCLGEASSASVACRADDDCGACGRCDNGVCVADALGAARPFCVDETEDPCDGEDDDGNGVVDDPEACWAPVWAWDSASTSRCFSSSPLAPPEGCAGYHLASTAPAFTLPARYLRGAVDLHQCSLGADHALVPATPLFGPSPDVAAPSAVDVWEALGYDCAVVLGRVLLSEPDFGGASAPSGRPCALSRFARPGTAAGAHVTWLGGGGGPDDAACDPESVVWVVSRTPACDEGAPAPCGPRCAPPTSEPEAAEPAASAADGAEPPVSPHLAHLVEAAPAPPHAVFTDGPLRFSIALANPGGAPWPAGLTLHREASEVLPAASAPLPALEPGGTASPITFTERAPQADGYTWVWRVEDAAGATVLVDGSPTFTTPVRVVDRLLQGVIVASVPAAGAAAAPRSEVQAVFALRNVGSSAWNSSFTFRRVAGSLAPLAELPVAHDIAPNTVGLFVIPLEIPDRPAGRRLSERWNLYDGHGRRVAFEVARPDGGTDYGSRGGAFLSVELVVGGPCSAVGDAL